MTNSPSVPTGLGANQSLRLVCLPHAGGGTAVFHRWRRAFAPQVALVPICYPGREDRTGEPLPADLRRLAAEVVDAIQPQVDRPFALLGHSMGAWIALEMAREFRRRRLPLPVLLIAAASRAPSAAPSGKLLHPLPDEEFVDEVGRQFDGIPPAVRSDSQLLQLLLPILRADIRLMETYEHQAEPPLDVDVLAIGGTDDRAVSAAELAGWRRHTSRKFSMRLVPGDHFFLFRDDAAHASAMPPAADMILRQLKRYIGR